MLWRVSFIFEGKQMENIMEFLAAQRGIHNVEGPVKAIEVEDRPLTDVLAEKFAGRKKVTRQQIKDWVEEVGRGGSTGYAYYVKRLVELGLIRTTSERGTYDVIAPKATTTKKRK